MSEESLATTQRKDPWDKAEEDLTLFPSVQAALLSEWFFFGHFKHFIPFFPWEKSEKKSVLTVHVLLKGQDFPHTPFIQGGRI